MALEALTTREWPSLARIPDCLRPIEIIGLKQKSDGRSSFLFRLYQSEISWCLLEKFDEIDVSYVDTIYYLFEDNQPDKLLPYALVRWHPIWFDIPTIKACNAFMVVANAFLCIVGQWLDQSGDSSWRSAERLHWDGLKHEIRDPTNGKVAHLCLEANCKRCNARTNEDVHELSRHFDEFTLLEERKALTSEVRDSDASYNM
ncbi:hypothetical protein BAUCODRAFT_33000 [Baudoinia panamericana UAMH 10762]|uniref:Uncharacterized protein n=1 Tax=Baudoinia panamericana (strain UAMH 10762) TaxID=717646 RepID=M2NE73_BAUPA|nr:uncharacterized protein BAUCODRAFT_33000 [Baudoinia panamericana UAMH 10762]EMC97255.1 hypothetical protein BAUCODRAFT_33000 [Baudoinia panamericana UAMH 10762]